MEKRNAAKAANTNEEPPATGDDPFSDAA
jgi:hypothetical protein